MAIKPHTLIAWGGTLSTASGGGEIWTNTLRVVGEGDDPLTLADCLTWLTEAHAAMAAYHALAASHIATSCTLDWLKCNSIGADGKYLSLTTGVYDYPTHVPGSGGASTGVPITTSTAISFKSSRGRGVASNGRIYPPNYLAGATPATDRVPAATVTDLLVSGRALLTAISNVAGTVPTNAVLISRSTPDYAYINAIRVGNVIDNLRRRKSALAEVYSEAAWAE